MTKTEQSLRDLLDFPTDRCEQMLRAAVESYADGNFSQAETILVGLITLNSDDARPLKLLASTCQLQDKHVQAETLYERALALEPDDPYVLVALGEIKLKALKLDEAVPLFEKLFDLDPEGQLAPANRGRELVKRAYERLTGAEP